MKIVINTCFGIFGLSDLAVEECIKLGMSVTEEVDEKGRSIDRDADFRKLPHSKWFLGQKYYAQHYESKKFRTNPILVSVVEKLGSKASSAEDAYLVVVEIPYFELNQFKIIDYDGKEKIIPSNYGE